MEVIDNFLSESEFKILDDTIRSNKFCWVKTHILVGSRFTANPIYNIQFCHNFIKTNTQINEGVLIHYEVHHSKYYNIIEPIVNKLDYSKFIRIKANLTCGNLNPEPTGWHVDVGDGDNVKPGYTGIYYVNTCNGHTLFKDGNKVDSVKNRMLIFDNQKEHAGVPCSDEKYRIVINFNWLP